MKEVVKHAQKGGWCWVIVTDFKFYAKQDCFRDSFNDNCIICKNTFLKPVSKSSGITKDIDFNSTYKIPIAHGEGILC